MLSGDAIPADAVQIRRAVAGDAPRLAALGAQVWLDTYASGGINASIAGYVAAEFVASRFEQIIAGSSSCFLVAEVPGDRLVGSVRLLFDAACPVAGGPSVEVANLYVQRHAAGLGIGSALLAQGRAMAFERSGSRRVWLTVNARNDAAKAFYQRRAYAEAGSTYFELDGVRYLNLVLLSPDD